MTIQPRGSQLALIVINDSDTVWQDTITVQRYSFAGEVLYEQTYSIDVPTRQNYQLLLDDGFHAYKKDAELIRAKASTDDGTADAWWFFDIDKRLDYPVSEYQLDVTVAEEGYTLNVTAQTFLRDVVVYADKLEPIAEVSEQLITLLPQESFTFTVRAARVPTVDELRANRVILCANDVIHDNSLVTSKMQ